MVADESTRADGGEAGALTPIRVRRKRLVDLAAVLVGLGFGVTLGLAFEAETWRALHAPGGWTTFLGRLAGLAGAYGMLVQLLLIARIPFVEKSVGQDRLVRWHRNLGQWPVYLIVLHALLITIGYAQQDHSGVLHQGWVLIDSYPDVLASSIALVLIVIASALSIRAARRRMRYETWWAVHLYMYLALALAFSHQIANGASFVGHPLARLYWAVLWASTAGVVLVFRVILPLARSFRHRLEVVGVQEESPGVVSIVFSGRDIDKLGAAGGQFFQWRFLKRGMWWQSHPYSISARPQPPYVRITVKALGDHSASLATLPSERVWLWKGRTARSPTRHASATGCCSSERGSASRRSGRCSRSSLPMSTPWSSRVPPDPSTPCFRGRSALSPPSGARPFTSSSEAAARTLSTRATSGAWCQT